MGGEYDIVYMPLCQCDDTMTVFSFVPLRCFGSVFPIKRYLTCSLTFHIQLPSPIVCSILAVGCHGVLFRKQTTRELVG